MGIFKKLFSKGESFIPTPTQQIPGLKPIVVQAAENLFPNIEDQKQVWQKFTGGKGGKKGDTLYLLSLLSYSNGKIEKLIDPEERLDYHFFMDEINIIFPNMKAAEKWVKSITKS